ncbi:hypothetical protein ACMA5I_01810 [Paracoccaceae bacterium GXU_MW_L88]
MQTNITFSEFKTRAVGLGGELGRHIARFDLRPWETSSDMPCLLRSADHDPADPLPEGYGCYLIEGDLETKGPISLSHLNWEHGDGNMILIVTGNLSCDRLVTEWGSLIIVGGDLTVRELFFAAREDSATIVIGDAHVWTYIGHDIPLDVGGVASIDYGFGYAQPLNMPDPFSKAVHPRHSEAETLLKLGYGRDIDALDDLDEALYGDVPPFR